MCYVWWSVNQIMVKFEINLKTEPLAWPLFIKDGLSSKSLGQIRYNEYEHRKRRPEGPHQHWSFRGSAGVFRCDHRPLKKRVDSATTGELSSFSKGATQEHIPIK